MTCQRCRAEISEGASFCKSCGFSISGAAPAVRQPGTHFGENQPAGNMGSAPQYGAPPPAQPYPYHPHGQVVVNQMQPQTNGIGVAGFVLALIGLFLSWIPVFGWIIWLVGLVLSFVGVFKEPRGLAIAGLVISLISVIILIAIIGAIGSFLGGFWW